MKKEDLIAHLNLLPDGTEVYVRKGDRIAEPLLNFYDTEPYPAPLTLVAYVETFYDELVDRGVDRPELLEMLTKPCHEYLHHVCHHGRSIMGTCGSCDVDPEDEDE